MHRQFTGPQAIAFLPAICLAAFWLGGEMALMLCAVALPMAVLLFGVVPNWEAERRPVAASPDEGHRRIAERLDTVRGSQLQSGLFLMRIDGAEEVMERHGTDTLATMRKQLHDRVQAIRRDGDKVMDHGSDGVLLCLSAVRRLDLEASIQIAVRLSATLDEPLVVDRVTHYVTASIGFCRSAHLLEQKGGAATGADWTEAVQTACDTALRNGPAAIREWAASQTPRGARPQFGDLERALDSGDVTAWFQPQISTDTGEIAGFEALARWNHPIKGVVPPIEFLSSIDAAGLMPRLSEIMVYNALTAIRAWDQSGLNIPQVAVNFSGAELADPQLPARIEWELDRFSIAPERLCVEVLETVVAETSEDAIARNINALAALGCRVDLDDFGTGHASITSLRRFSISRLKIDKSFVRRVDTDTEQQQMVTAILSMADNLGLETLAEGVETVGEHAWLAQMGCGFVQGFGIARPMPFDKTLDWISKHSAKLAIPPQVGPQGLPKRREG